MKKIPVILFLFLLNLLAYSKEKEGITTFQTDNKVIYDICFSAGGEVLGIADNNEIKVFKTSNRELIRKFKDGHRRQIMTIDISKDSTLMVSGGKDSTIIIWDFIYGTKLKTLYYHKGLITSVKISPDSRYLISGSTDDKVCLYDIKTEKLVGQFSEHTDDITCVTFSPDGKLFAAGGGDNIITLYSTEKSGLLAILPGHKGWVRDISFFNDGKKLISCGDDAQIMKWDITDLNMTTGTIEKKNGHAWILCLDNSEDDTIRVFGAINGSILIYWRYGTYSGNLGVVVNKILLKPLSKNFLQICVATTGKGVMLIDASGLKYSKAGF